jgi:hypothetical protein
MNFFEGGVLPFLLGFVNVLFWKFIMSSLSSSPHYFALMRVATLVGDYAAGNSLENHKYSTAKQDGR